MLKQILKLTLLPTNNPLGWIPIVNRVVNRVEKVDVVVLGATPVVKINYPIFIHSTYI